MRNKIIGFFKKQKGVAAVYLFGSQSKKTTHRQSDVDVAVLYENKHVPDFQKQLEFKEALASLLKKDVDIVILNKANPILKHQVLRYGKILFSLNPSLVNNFFVRAVMEYDDIKRIRAIVEKSILKGRVYG